jgi:phosphoribosylaminoimidazolecarboxamide formyltransferase/IMP cyclohydrolase
MTSQPIKRALLSVSDKTNIVTFAEQLQALGIELLSTGGTSQLLRENGVAVKDVAEMTGFPEIMEGRVKTLHPKVHGGILGKRKSHADIAKAHGIEWIDLVVVNLYPFAKVTQQSDCSFEKAVENIDIGGPTMIRAAAKNMDDVTVVVDPSDYEFIISQLQADGGLKLSQRQVLAQKAFAHTAEYDQLIQSYLAKKVLAQETFAQQQSFYLQKVMDLRYGENPDQQACAYRLNAKPSAILDAAQHQGKVLSYNNIVDADAALNCVRQFEKTACVIVKHANPCGVASGNSAAQAFDRAFAADSTSAFGGIIALNSPCDGEAAALMIDKFFEVVLAPSFTKEALSAFQAKPNVRLLSVDFAQPSEQIHYQHVAGVMLAQTRQASHFDQSTLKVVTKAVPTEQAMKNLAFSWQVVAHIKSNAIVVCKDEQTLGIGPGQVSRIDAVDIAIRKAGEKAVGASLASDAFFPFKDSIEQIAKAGITSIIQPGGSIRDEEVIAACNQHGIAMVFTGNRCFRH